MGQTSLLPANDAAYITLHFALSSEGLSEPVEFVSPLARTTDAYRSTITTANIIDSFFWSISGKIGDFF